MYYISMKQGTFKTEAVDNLYGCEEVLANFPMIFGQKTFVDEQVGGKATFRITFFQTDGLVEAFADFKFAKGLTKKEMLERGLEELGFETERQGGLEKVCILGLK